MNGPMNTQMPYRPAQRTTTRRGDWAYYNENEPYAAEWLKNLIAAGHLPAGDVDSRSIKDVQPDDRIGYTQCQLLRRHRRMAACPTSQQLAERQRGLDRLVSVPTVQCRGKAKRI